MDPIADLLTRLRNAQAAKKEKLCAPFSNLKFQILKILKEGDFIKEAVKKMNREIEIILNYEQSKGKISSIKKISKPGQRVYLKAKEIKSIRQGRGIAIISTSQGLMSNKEAKKKKLGGEVLCEVW